MSAATEVRPEVAAFVARVREHLADLTDEECEELVGGLEADLSEQAADGALVLPDPAQYAVELRAAAGLPPSGRSRLPRLRSAPLKEWPDMARAQWFALTEHSAATRQCWTLLETLRPAWWVLRAWIALTLLDQVTGPWEYVTLWPTLGAPLVGPLLLIAAVVVSVLIGQGKLWPGAGPDRSTLARMVLLVLNALAVVAPLTFTGDGSQVQTYAYAVPRPPDKQVLRHGSEVVRNIYAYDAAGQPLVGVQLFDQEGRPVAVAPESSMGRGRDRAVTCPWVNGTTPLYNVFPLRQRLQPRGTCVSVDAAKVGDPTFSEPPLASVPPATLPDGTVP